jgi:hypothetical protein
MSQGRPCAVHPDQPIVGTCDRCGDFGCRDCIPRGKSCLRCVPVPVVPQPDIGKVFGFVFQDPRWLSKVLMGSGCLFFSFLIVPMFLLHGYAIRIARRAKTTPDGPLPEWDNLGSLLWDGFKCWLVTFLPMMALYMVLVVGILALVLITLATNGSYTAGASPDPPIIVIVGIVLMVLGFSAAMFLFSFLGPAIAVVYLDTGSVLSAFHFRALWKVVVERPVDYLLFFVISLAIYFLAAIAGELTLFVGLFFTMPWMFMTLGYFVGRWSAWHASLAT